MSNIDWSQLITREQKERDRQAEILAAKKAVEVKWKSDEMEVIAEQLLMLEDEDPTAYPGNEAQWRAYRILVRAWKDGHPDYPDMTKRPTRPQ